MKPGENQSLANRSGRWLFSLLLAANLLAATGTLFYVALERHGPVSSPESRLQHSLFPPSEPRPFGGEPSAIPNLGLLKREIVAYHDTGRWKADTAAVVRRAMDFMESHKSSTGKPAIVFDIDDTALSTWEHIKEANFCYLEASFDRWVLAAGAPPIEPVLDLYRLAKRKGVAVFFITGRAEKLREPTLRNLRATGYETWEEVLMKPADYKEESIIPHKAGQRRKLVEKGYDILVNIGDQDSDLEGGFADRVFKIPNPAYYIP
jgi:acid phosphatase